MAGAHEGGCLCGAVRYQATGQPMRATVCHCTFCQRITGSAFGVWVTYRKEQVALSGGSFQNLRLFQTVEAQRTELARYAAISEATRSSSGSPAQ